MPLLLGDFAPHFKVASSVNPNFNFDTVAGRYVVLSFFYSTQYEPSEKFLTRIVERGDRFDVTNAIFFGVTVDPDDVERIQHQHPGRIFFYDLDRKVSELYGLVSEVIRDDGEPVTQYTTRTFILDQSLRVIAMLQMEDPDKAIEAVFDVLNKVPPLSKLSVAAPVLIVPYVLEPKLCRRLIDYYEMKGGEDSGFMRDVDGKTTGLIDYAHKRRMDCEIVDHELIKTVQERISRRIIPAIRQAYQFNVTRIERHIVACYDAAQGAHFRAHRDNTTLGTAHRRFAVTINLNSPEYEGGEIWFPEFGPKLFKAPSGAAIVFSCSLLHEVPPVTRGRRYAFLPFLYDDAAAEIRERNRKYLHNLEGAGGRKIEQKIDCNALENGEPSGRKINLAAPIIDGQCGCGNPDGCETCLSAAAYELPKDEEK